MYLIKIVLQLRSKLYDDNLAVKFVFSKKATKIDEIFTIDLTLCCKRLIDNEDFVNFRVLLRKY